MATHLRLYANDKTALGLLPDHRGLIHQVVFGDTGSLAFEYPLTGVNADLLNRDVGYVALVVDGEEWPDWFLLDDDTDDKTDEQGVNRGLKVTARGLLALLEQAEVYPAKHTPGANPNGMAPEHVFKAASPGLILKTLLDKAKARGCFPDLTYTFTGALDTAGTAWPSAYDVTYAAGTSYLEVLRDMLDKGWLDVRMNGFELQAYKPDTTMGITRSNVVLRLGQNVLDGPRKRSRRGIVSHMLGIGADKIMQESGSAATAAKYGRREGNASDGQLTTAASVKAVADAALTLNSNAKEGYTLKLAMDAPAGETWWKPGKDFLVGEKVYYDQQRNSAGDLDPVRVRTISWEWGSPTQPATCSIEVNDLFVESKLRLARQVAGVTGGSKITSPPPPKAPPKDITVPLAPANLTTAATSYLDGAINRARVVVGWDPVFYNTDDSDYVDHLRYNVQYRTGGAAGVWKNVPSVQDPGVTLEALPVNIGFEVRVNAQDNSGHASAWTTSASITLPKDGTVPPIPAQLDVTSRLGVVTVGWNGKDSTGAGMPADFAYIEVFRSTDPASKAPAGTTIGRIYAANGTIVLSNLPYNVTQYFTAVAYDLTGNISTGASPAAFLSTAPLVNTDVIGQVINGAANIIAGSVPTTALEQAAQDLIKNAPHIYRDPNEPTPPAGGFVDGDLWIDTDDGNKPYRYNKALGPIARANECAYPNAKVVSANVEVRRNLATNPNFETGVTGFATNNGVTYPVTLDTSAPITGTQSAISTRTTDTPNSVVASIYGNGLAVGGLQTLKCAPGDQVAMSMAIKVENTGRVYTAYLAFRDAAGNVVGNNMGSNTGDLPAPGIVTRIGATATAPANSDSVVFVANVGTKAGDNSIAGERVWWDEWLVEKGLWVQVRPYFCGSTVKKNLATGLAWSTLGAGTTATPGVVMNGKTWTRISHPQNGNGVRYNLNLSDLSNGFTYTASLLVYNESSQAVTLDPQWCDAGTGTYVLQPGETRRLSVSGVRATYDNTYRFIDLEFNGAFVGSVLVTEELVEPGTRSNPYYSGTAASADGLVFSWAGAVNASESIATGTNAFGWSGSNGVRNRGASLPDGSGNYVDLRGSSLSYTNVGVAPAVGEFWSGRVTLQGIPGETATGQTVQVRMHDGTAYMADPYNNGGSMYVTLPADGSPITVDLRATAALAATAAPRIYLYPTSGGAVRASYPLMEKVSGVGVAAGAWFDGSSKGAAWVGTVDQSRSTYTPGWVVVQDGAIAAANSLAQSALTSANGKNKVTYSASAAAAGTPGVVVGDTWFQRDVTTGVVSGQWEWDGTVWKPKTLASAVIAALDAGKITTGTLDAARVRVGSTSTFDNGYNPATAGNGNYRVLKTPLATGMVGTVTGSYVIQTAIPFGNYMTRVDISGYIYLGSGQSDFRLSTTFYAYSVGPLLLNQAWTNYGATAPSAVRLGRHIATGNVVIILDAPTAGWQYPKIIVDAAAGAGLTEAMAQGWSGTFVTDFTPYDLITTVPGRDLNDSYGLTQGWRKTGTTTIDGGKIAADSVTAVQVAAGAITTEKLTVGAIGDELVFNGSFEDVSAANASMPATWRQSPTSTGPAAGISYETANALAGGRSMKLAVSLFGQANQSAGIESKDFPVVEGSIYSLRVTAKDDVGTSPGFYFGLIGGATVGASTSQVWLANATNVTVPTAVTEYSGTVTIPAGWKYARVIVLNYSPTSTAVHTVTVDAVSCRRVIVSAQLADGAITTPKLAALSVDAGKIAANAVKADKIEAGAVTAEKVALGVMRSNLVPDPSFEEEYEVTELLDPAYGFAVGNPYQWRRETYQNAATGENVTKMVTGRARSGRRAISLTSPANVGDAAAISGAFPITPGKTYSLALNACSITAQGTLAVAVIYGSGDLTTVSFLNQVTLLGATDTMTAPPLLPEPVDPSSYESYAWTFDAPAGATFAAVRLVNFQPTALSTVVVDDVSVIELGYGASELTAAGLRLFGANGLEIGAFVSNRPNYFSVTSNGATVASISEKGMLSGTGLTLSDPVNPTALVDPTIGGVPLIGKLGASLFDNVSFDNNPAVYARDYEVEPVGIIEQYAKGNVAWCQFNGADFTQSITAGQEMSLFELGFDCEPGRQYTFRHSPILCNISGTAGIAGIRLRYTSDGSIPNLNSGVLAYDYGWAATNFQAFCVPSRLFNGGATVQTQLRVLLCLYSSSPTVSVYNGQSILGHIEDLGPAKTATGSIRNYKTGGTTSSPTPVVKTYTKTYTSLGSATYKGDGTKRTDTGDVVQGYNSYNGNGKGIWSFPSMTGDLAGATVNKIEVYAYANHWYNNAGGTARIGVHGYSSAPASSPSLTYATQSTGWPKPGGRWVTLPSSFYAGFKAGTYKGFGMGPAPSNDLGYYGRFNGGAGAMIRVTYTK